MSDFQQDPGATQVLPAAPPASPPRPPDAPAGAPVSGGRGGVPWWAALLMALLIGVAAAGITWAVTSMSRSGVEPELARVQDENATLQKKIDDLTSRVATLTAQAEAAKNAGAQSGATGGTSESGSGAAESGKQFAFVKNVAWDSATNVYSLVADYAQFLTGAQAASAAAARGDESPPPNDYYIVNDNPKLRTFPVKAGISVTVHGWGGGDAFAKSTIPFGQWFDVMPGGVNPQAPWDEAPYWITISGGQVVKIEQQYLP